MARILVKQITKKFVDFIAVKDISLKVDDETFVVIVGPSGCGKTTTLRLIAGLERPTSGEIYIGDRMVNNVAPKDRDIAMVFQNYALYPHKRVFDNIAFGLQLRKFPKEEIRKRVIEASNILGINHLLDRKPAQLSGGERQRVAMGRAMVRKPQVFLFDEPLSNLDAKLRVHMRAEIAKIHNRIKTTVVYVTHDQVEAMTLASKIVIMNEGAIVQEGSPSEVYDHPNSRFVADFIGSPSMNFIDVVVINQDGNLFLKGGGISIPIPEKYSPFYNKYIGKDVVFGLRPEHIQEYTPENVAGKEKVEGIIDVIEPMGSESIVFFKISTNEFITKLSGKFRARCGEGISLLFDMNEMHLFDLETNKVIQKQ